MKVKYQITMEVEVEVDNLNDKKTNRAEVQRLANRAKMGLKDSTINKVKVERIGATGVTPRDTRATAAARAAAARLEPKDIKEAKTGVTPKVVKSTEKTQEEEWNPEDEPTEESIVSDKSIEEALIDQGDLVRDNEDPDANPYFADIPH